jgi:glycosyltransferase involved in cell wall biosynthesis/SAM-dependent methyltransferase
MRAYAEVEVFSSSPERFDPSAYDGIVYQIGNNGFHSFVYEAALQWPGTVVMHESNLHHLICDLTIRRNDWDAYMGEVVLNGTAADIAYSLRVRSLAVGPDYEGIPMLRRLLGAAKQVITHSHAVESDVRAGGFGGPIAVIPHGAWLPESNRMKMRHKLGLDETTPLIGIFGFLKPYKRIAEALRAFRRLVKLQPDAKMILCGEAHPEFKIPPIVHALGIEGNVRMLGFVSQEEFMEYMDACDIVLNLRYPTVGESSGSLMRALGLGKAVLVSNIGSFAELPDDVCMKVAVDASEEDAIFEYLNVLVSRPSVRLELGRRARSWVERECNWDLVSRRYVDFVGAGKTPEAVVPNPPPCGRGSLATGEEAVEAVAPAAAVEPEYLLGWSTDKESAKYFETHMTRLQKTLAITPAGTTEDRILEMGAYLQITPSLKSKLGYGDVRGCYYGPAGRVEVRKVVSSEGEEFACEIDLFDAERDRFPYPDGHFSTVLCCELLEHLPNDPMFMMSEINRILKPGGHLVLTTPNITSLRAVAAILGGYHPGFFPAYIRPRRHGEEVEARHNREYAPREMLHLFADAGFHVTLLETGEFLDEPHPEFGWVHHLLDRYILPSDLRGDGIYVVGRKDGPVKRRYPGWLYQGGEG